MSIHQDKARGRLVFEFSHRINGQRKRVVRLLPKGWTRADELKFQRKYGSCFKKHTLPAAKAVCTI